MTGFSVNAGQRFVWDGAEFVIDRLTASGDAVVERAEDGKPSIVTARDLLEHYRCGRIAGCEDAAPPLASRVAVFSRPLAELPESIRGEVRRRNRYLEGVCEHGDPVFTPRYLDPLLKSIAEELGDLRPPSAATFYRWFHRRQAFGDGRGLVPRVDRRGSSAVRQSHRLQELMRDAIEEAFRESPLATANGVWTKLSKRIEIENLGRIGADLLKLPSLRTVHRALKRMDVYDQIRLREGKAAADRRLTVTKLGPKSSRILERVEVDHTPLDLFVIDERTWLPMGRPLLTMILDHRSRMPLGYHLSFDNPSTAAVMRALKHAVAPKAPPVQAISTLNTEHAWACYGVPEVLVVDNGLEFHSNDFELAALALGIRLDFCPKRTPRFKGSVERYLKTINFQFAHQLPGTSFARFHLRGDYDPQRAALITFGELTQLFEKWTLDVYAQTVHRGLGTTPWAAWHEGLRTYEPRLPRDIGLLHCHLGLTVEPKVRRDGFQIEGIRYGGAPLQPILWRYGESVRVRVVFDPDDMGTVQVWGPDDQEPVSVQALDFAYASGLSRRQNACIREHSRIQGQETSDAEALMRAKQDLSTAVQELMVSRKATERRRAAAIRNIASNRPTGSSHLEQPNPRRPKPKPVKVALPSGGSVGDQPPVILQTLDLPTHTWRTA